MRNSLIRNFAIFTLALFSILSCAGKPKADVPPAPIGAGSSATLKDFETCQTSFTRLKATFRSEYESVPAVRMRYPRIALVHGIEGCVVLKFSVDKTGQATNIKVVEEIPIGWTLAEKATSHLLNRKFKPKEIENTANLFQFKLIDQVK